MQAANKKFPGNKNLQTFKMYIKKSSKEYLSFLFGTYNKLNPQSFLKLVLFCR